MSGNGEFEPRFERRAADRTGCELLQCSLGQVSDLSEKGMQVRGRGEPMFEPGHVLEVQLNGVPHPVRVRAETVWVQGLGDGEGFAAGFRFRDLSESTAADLETLVRTERQIGAVTQEGLVHFPDIQN